MEGKPWTNKTVVLPFLLFFLPIFSPPLLEFSLKKKNPECVHTGHTAALMSGVNLQKLAVSFCHTAPGTRRGGKCPDPLGHLVSPAFLLFPNFIILIDVCVHLLCGCEQAYAGVCRPEALDPLELELQFIISHLMVPRIELWSSGRAAHAVNH